MYIIAADESRFFGKDFGRVGTSFYSCIVPAKTIQQAKKYRSYRFALWRSRKLTKDTNESWFVLGLSADGKRFEPVNVSQNNDILERKRKQTEKRKQIILEYKK